ARTSGDAGDLLRRFPGIRVRSMDVGGQRLLCVNRGRGGRDRSSLTSALEGRGAPGCDTLPVFVDGQPMMNPERLLGTMSPENIESIELVTSTQAAAYPGAQNGAIVIYTRGNGPWAQRRR
ncbi:MAG: Plug domain-containing protein, partial [Longimicrobiales bacterium]